MCNLVYNELYKMVANWKLLIFLLITLVAVAIPSMVMFIPEAHVVFTGQDYPLMILNGLVTMVLPIFIIIMLAEMFTTEYEKGTLKNTLIQPVSRIQVVVGKLLAVVSIVGFLLLVALIAGYGFGIAVFGWGEGIAIGGNLLTSSQGIIATVTSYVVSLIPLTVFAVFIAVLCIILSSGTAALGISIGLFLAMNIAGQLVEKLSPYLINTHFNLYIFVMEEALRVQLVQSIVALVVYGVVSSLLVAILFKKKEIIL
ncbi:hypothetical protein BHU72_04585 [Desulfuribacillus stibiiarsenatis]|uniref:ABC transporter permease n=1 Tax=Desulfuribacillus stibiiarsenatis TaxID=1390249 RepID=A0A1E5L5D4_9FIRM|nr:ABC transporter permease subunit [Desulfuribacillus stibiiarsenatis]OEH85372.1 hypothetical protein BHU72_04585 [Desulfuribacillus stibiiarsenatis]